MLLASRALWSYLRVLVPTFFSLWFWKKKFFSFRCVSICLVQQCPWDSVQVAVASVWRGGAILGHGAGVEPPTQDREHCPSEFDGVCRRWVRLEWMREVGWVKCCCRWRWGREVDGVFVAPLSPFSVIRSLSCCLCRVNFKRLNRVFLRGWATLLS